MKRLSAFLNIKNIIFFLFVFIIPSIYADDKYYSEFKNISIRLTQEEKDWLDNHRKIRISGPLNFPPFHFFGEEEEAFGISADYIRYIAGSIGIEIETYKKYPWTEVLSKAEKKEIDVIACSARSPEREEYLSFTDSYISYPMVIISRNDSGFIGGLDDLHSLKIALVKGTVVREWLERDGIDVVPYTTQTPIESLESVSSGEADACIENLAAASYLISNHGFTNLKVAAPTKYRNYELFLAVRNDWPELVSIINKWLAALPPEKHSEIRNEWLSLKYEYGIRYIDIVKYVLVSAAFFITILSVILVWNRKLKKEVESRRKAEMEKEKLINELKEALADIDLLGGLLPICSNCRKIRDDNGYWNQLEHYLEENSDLSFSHGLCPECEKALYGNEDWYNS